MNLEFTLHNLININNPGIMITDVSSNNGKSKSITLNNEKLSDVFNISKIVGFQQVIDFFNINKFIFDIDNTFKIEIIESGKIIFFEFESFFSAKTVLQYDITQNKFKLFVHSKIIGIQTETLSFSVFNLMCKKISENNTVHNNFSIKYPDIKLNEVKTYLTDNLIPFSEFSSGHFSLIEIVRY
jgi:hypothetical protein